MQIISIIASGCINSEKGSIFDNSACLTQDRYVISIWEKESGLIKVFGGSFDRYINLQNVMDASSSVLTTKDSINVVMKLNCNYMNNTLYTALIESSGRVVHLVKVDPKGITSLVMSDTLMTYVQDADLYNYNDKMRLALHGIDKGYIYDINKDNVLLSYTYNGVVKRYPLGEDTLNVVPIDDWCRFSPAGLCIVNGNEAADNMSNGVYVYNSKREGMCAWSDHSNRCIDYNPNLVLYVGRAEGHLMASFIRNGEYILSVEGVECGKLNDASFVRGLGGFAYMKYEERSIEAHFEPIAETILECDARLTDRERTSGYRGIPVPKSD